MRVWDETPPLCECSMTLDYVVLGTYNFLDVCIRIV